MGFDIVREMLINLNVYKNIYNNIFIVFSLYIKYIKENWVWLGLKL